MITGLNHVTFSVADLNRAFKFYRDILGLRPVARWYRGAYLLAGEMWVCLNLETEVLREPQATYTHVAFTVSQHEFSVLAGKITRSGTRIWRKNLSEGASLYFLDPDGHKLEIHASDLTARLAALKQAPPRDLILFHPDSE